MGKGKSEGREVDFNQQIIGSSDWAQTREPNLAASGQDLWNLKVYESGVTRMGMTGGSVYKDDLNCDSNSVFVVTKPSLNMGGDWEQSIKTVKLTLSECEATESFEVCNIKIEDNVGIQFNSSFTPKAIFK